MITLYDLPSKVKDKSWNPNAWKARYTLNYKGIPYQTVWVEYPDIEKVCKEIGAEPTTTKPDGSPFYTVPFIRDDSTGTVVADSLKIARYLDKTYPETPTVVAPGTYALTAAAIDGIMSKLSPLWSFVLPPATLALNPRSEEYFRRTREPMFGKIEDLIPKGDQRAVEWKKVEEGFGAIDAWIDKNSTFMAGEAPCLADFAIAGILIWTRKILGGDSDEWNDILGWHDGRWARLMQKLEKYETVI